MSAFMVEDSRYSDLFATLKGDRFWVEHWRYLHSEMTPLHFVQALRNQNLRSVNKRYRTNDTIEPFFPQPQEGRILGRAELYKLLDCISYQSCEIDDWYGHPCEIVILRIQNLISDVLVGLLPEYKEAAWG